MGNIVALSARGGQSGPAGNHETPSGAWFPDVPDRLPETQVAEISWGQP
jgi:hypothetical protein